MPIFVECGSRAATKPSGRVSHQRPVAQRVTYNDALSIPTGTASRADIPAGTTVVGISLFVDTLAIAVGLAGRTRTGSR